MSGKPGDLPARVAVPERTAAAIRQGIMGLRGQRREVSTDLRADIRALRAEQRSDVRWVPGIMLSGGLGLPGVMAHGFHWF